MSIIQSIRDKGTWIIGGVIAIALISFILQDGLNKRGSIFGSSTNIGKVNGVAIDKEEFFKKVEQASKNNPQQREQIVNQMFDQEVTRILLDEEFEKAGITCTTKELEEEMFKPNSQLVQQFKDPNTGMADVEKAKQWYKDFKKNPREDAKQYIYELVNQTKLMTKYNKYNSFINQAAYVPKWLIEKQQADNNAVASLSYIAVPYSTINDSTVKVSDDEILAYGKKHHKLYDKTDETRSIKYVSFEAIPSTADTAAAKSKVELKKADFVAATDMENFFARNNSEIKYLNTFLSGKAIQQPVKDSLFKLAVGATYGPYLDANNWVIAKMVATRSIPDSVHARHILIKTAQQNPQTGEMMAMGNDSAAKHTLDTVVMKLKAGGNFDSLCAKYSEDGSAKTGGDLKFFSSGQMVSEFNDFCFTNNVGATGIVKTQFGFHYIEILANKGSSPAYKIAYFAKPINLSTETDIAIKAEATKFLAATKSAKQFDEEVAKLKKQAINADNIKKEDLNAGMLANCRPLVKWTYEKSVGDITEEPQHINNKYIAAVVTEINKAGLPGAKSLRGQVENLVKNEKKAKQILDKCKGSTLEAMATAVGNNTVVNRVDSFLATNPFVGIIGNDNKFTGAAFNISNKGKVTEPIAGSSAVFALKVDNIGAKPSTNTDTNSIKGALSNIIKSLANRTTGELLKKAASITDNRSENF